MPKTKKYLFFISQDYSFPVLRPLHTAIISRGDIVKWFLYGEELDYTLLNKDEERLYDIKSVINYNPDAVFVPGNVVPSFIPGLKVQVFHGLPGGKTKKNGASYHYLIRGMFDLYCTQGLESTKRFKLLEEKYQYFHVKETGWTKLDPLFPLDIVPITKHKKAIFFASTFSPRYTKAKILYPFLLTLMKKYDYTWYITLHPKMDRDTINLYRSISLDNVHFISSTDIMYYFKKSDIMLCDISSIVYEFLTQIKPVITFQSPQKTHSIINVDSFQMLEKTLLLLLENPSKKHMETITKEVKQFHSYQDGNSSYRVLNCVEKLLKAKYKAKKKKPLNMIRNLKLRITLKYWAINYNTP